MFISSGTTSKVDFMDNLDNLAALRSVNLDGDLAAVSLVLNGSFDKKIKEYVAAKKAFDATEEVVKTVEQAQKLLKDAQNQMDASTVFKNEVIAKEKDLLQREANIQKQLDQFANEYNALLAEKEEFSKQQAQAKRLQENWRADIAAVEVDLMQQHQKIVDETNKLESEKAAFNARLDALKA